MWWWCVFPFIKWDTKLHIWVNYPLKPSFWLYSICCILVSFKKRKWHIHLNAGDEPLLFQLVHTHVHTTHIWLGEFPEKSINRNAFPAPGRGKKGLHPWALEVGHRLASKGQGAFVCLYYWMIHIYILLPLSPSVSFWIMAPFENLVIGVQKRLERRRMTILLFWTQKPWLLL